MPVPHALRRHRRLLRAASRVARHPDRTCTQARRSSGRARHERDGKLSPFQVASDAAKGYQALNTHSGTRPNSKLEDLGSPITVVTKQQKTDLELLDINDVFRYEASTEGTDIFTGFTRNRTGCVGY